MQRTVFFFILALGLGAAFYGRGQAIDSATLSQKNADMAQMQSSNPLRVVLSR